MCVLLTAQGISYSRRHRQQQQQQQCPKDYKAVETVSLKIIMISY